MDGNKTIEHQHAPQKCLLQRERAVVERNKINHAQFSDTQISDVNTFMYFSKCVGRREMPLPLASEKAGQTSFYFFGKTHQILGLTVNRSRSNRPAP